MQEKCKICDTDTFVGIALWQIKEEDKDYPLCINCTDLMMNAAKQFKIRIKELKDKE